MKKVIRKTLLYKSAVEYADYAINHAEGCSHGCTYPCYAMMMKKRCGVVKTYKDWLTPKIVGNALELLDKEIPKYKKDIKFVYLCFTTDPFMYKQKEVIDLSLKIIERLNKDKIKTISISKGIYPKELVKNEIYGTNNEYGSTIVSLSEDFRKKHEPFAAPIKNRIESLKFLHDNGFKTWISMEPYPTPNFIQQDIKKILEEVSFVDKIVFGKWNYSSVTSHFKDYKKFYNESSYKVIEFCKENGIEYHIKEGTISRKIVGENSNTIIYKKPIMQYSFA